jgi:GntR family transcriptional regulator
MVIHRMSRSEEVERALLERLETLADADGRLPTEADIAEMFGVSRGTVRSAVGALATRGLVVRKQGMGTFLKRVPHLHNPIDEAIDFCEVIARNGRKPGQRFLKAAIETPDALIGEALEQPGQPALVRHTVFTADGDPVIYCVNTFPLSVVRSELAERVVADPQLSEPLYDFLEAECGERLEYHRSTIWPALAADCNLLEPVGHPLAPVIVIDEIGYSAAGRPIVHSREVYPDAFMRFEMIRRRGRRL